MRENHYQKIADYLTYLTEKRNLHICIKDFCGFIPINKELDTVLRPFLAHTNPFCMYIKQDRGKYHECLSLIRLMYNKCEKSLNCFYGVCHAGLGEYVIPVAYDDILLGTINIGFFQNNEKRTEHLVRRCCKASPILDPEEALRLYHRHITSANVDVQEILVNMQMVSEYLGNTYQAIRSAHLGQTADRPRYHSSEDTIITHAIEYIRQRYNTHISVGEIADFCHCSESYLSRIFKKRTGVNINVYINKVRVEISKNYLLLTSDSVAEIAMNLGFSDPNYYSRVFTSLIGHPPTEFRRRFRGDAQMAAPSINEIISLADDGKTS